jgi:diaminopimelate decarboxylase
MNDMMRPALYGAIHPITRAVKQKDVRVLPALPHRVDIVGPVCETGDCFLNDWPLGKVNSGDLLVLWGAGAYGMVAASNYNSRPRAPEILVEGSRFRIIRRRESLQDLCRGEF